MAKAQNAGQCGTRCVQQRKIMTRVLERVATMAAIASGIAGISCSRPPEGQTRVQGSRKSDYVFGLIAKSQNNPVFVSCRIGAEDAAVELSKRYGVRISVRWQTPNEEDAQKQAQFIELLVNQGVDAIGI